MFGLFKKNVHLPNIDDEGNIYDPEDIVVHYEGQFENGQYHGKGILIHRHGEVLEGTFKENKFVKDI